MTDRELLELAAKASGILNASWSGNEAYFDGVITTWNPLNDDGDALRLAVNLGLVVCIMNNPGFTGVYLPNCAATGKYDEVQMHKNDPAHATRRAITMAAAQIGEAMA